MDQNKSGSSGNSSGGSSVGTIKPAIPAGFLDFLPREFLARERMLTIIKRIFRSYGYDPIETPTIEFLPVLAGEDETAKSIFSVSSKLAKTEELPLALRFDMTVPLARFLAAHPYIKKTQSGIKLPFKRSTYGKVFRGENPQKGRYREFGQFDVDIVGVEAMIADTEIISVMYETLRALGLECFVIKVNNRKILNGLAELIGVEDRGQVSADDIVKSIFRILDKINKIGLDGVIEELSAAPVNEYDPSPGLNPEAIAIVQRFLNINGTNGEKLAQAKEIFQGIEIATTGLSELGEVLLLCAELGVPDEYLELDLSIARGLDYYTGTVMETLLLDAPEYGSIFSGGRYNDLMKRFTGQEMPAVGASIGVDRLFTVLKYLNCLPRGPATASEVVVMRLDSALDAVYLKIAESIRRLGCNTEVSLLDDTTFKAQLNYALSREATWLVIVGGNEYVKGEVTIRNLVDRQQVTIRRDELINYFKDRSTK